MDLHSKSQYSSCLSAYWHYGFHPHKLHTLWVKTIIACTVMAAIFHNLRLVPSKLKSYKNTRGNSLKLNKQFCSTDVRKYFFSSRVIDAWNSLSNDVVKSPSVCMFKKRLHTVNSDRFLTITYWLFLVVYWFLSLFFNLIVFHLRIWWGLSICILV